MAQVVLSSVGAAIGGPVGGAIGSLIGSIVDRAAVSALRPARQVGPRLEGLRLQSTAEGAAMAAVFGRVRIAGEVIWAARFRETPEEGRSGGGKATGQRTVSHTYSVSFAVGLCEGPIDGIGRIWADGQPFDRTGVTMRVHLGTREQTPDPLIEAVEGETPAFRDTAYVVFEDLGLEAYGNRIPQFSFEIFKGLRRTLEEKLTGVCLIPGAGEFFAGTTPVLRREGLTRTAAENVNNTDGRTDLTVALDQLKAQLPNVERVSLVVTWFGDDLRAGECRVRPGVESLDKATIPYGWRAGGVGRADAHLISQVGGRPAFGGTPSDKAVLEAIVELKSRGYAVTLYPFLMMDVPAGNSKPNPYGGSSQPAYPWRGRITCAAGTDGTGSAATQAAGFFGDATAAEVGVEDGLPSWTGEEDAWGWRRCVLHYARLAEIAGGVDGFLIGSELRGLTWVRDGAGGYPAVAALKALANDVRGVLRAETLVSYAADWSEWFGHQPSDGSGDARFHLDPLWSDPAVSYVGIDWYPPAADWRAGSGGWDAALWKGPHDRAYLEANVAGGEAFDWYYADEAGRVAQDRLPISDGAHGEPWVFRPKDLIGWWSHAHHDRPGGLRSATPTGWTPGMKPIRFTEFGCPAVDRGANEPNLFPDPKSSESDLPIDSAGTRDDLVQRRCLEAALDWFGEAANNPLSGADGRPMLAAMDAWCWDARPFPDFPARKAVWADGPNWELGHWLTGRAGVGSAASLIEAILSRAGIGPEDFDLSEVTGEATGYVIDRPMRVRDSLEPLSLAWGFDACERGGRIGFAMRTAGAVRALTDDEVAVAEDEAAPMESRVLETPADAARVRFFDEADDYQVGAAAARRDQPAGGGTLDVDLPLVTTVGEGERVARRLLSAEALREGATVGLGPEASLALEPGDTVSAPELMGVWKVAEVVADERPRAVLRRAETVDGRPVEPAPWRPKPPTPVAAPPVLHLLDLPPLPGREDDSRPIVAAASEPWRALEVWAGADAGSLTRRARVEEPATVGVTLSALNPGPLWRVDRVNTLDVLMEGRALQSRSAAEVADGRNALAVLSATGAWEVLQFTSAEMIGVDRWRLSGLLRGQQGSDGAMVLTPAGAAVVLLEPGLARAEVASFERGLPRVWRAAPAGGPAGGTATTEVAFAWRGVALKPWTPAHLRARRVGSDLAVNWVRRARVGGDGWDEEPPLGEEAERWRVRVLSGATVKRTVELGAAGWTYLAAEQAADFGGAAPAGTVLEVAQRSAVVGSGGAASLTI